MVNIASYIAGLLGENDYVVIPGLGAFISAYQPARIEDNGTMVPPSRIITFHHEMKINDGLLAEHLSRQLRIPVSETRKIVDRYAGDVVFRLEREGKFAFEGIGTLYHKEGLYTFDTDCSADLFPGNFGLKPVLLSGPLREILPGIPVSDVKKAKKKSPVFFLLISIPVFVALVVAGYFLFHPTRSTRELPENRKQAEAIADNDSVAVTVNDTIPGTQPETVFIPADTLPRHPKKELYYSIGGSFKSQENADEYFNDMTRKGFHPINLGMRGGFYLVALDTFFNVNAAYNAAFSHSRQFPGTEVWIFHAGN